MKDDTHWTDYVPVLIRFPVAAIIAILGALLIPTMVINKYQLLQDIQYRIGEIFSE